MRRLNYLLCLMLLFAAVPIGWASLEVVQFRAQQDDSLMIVRWETESEFGYLGFNIWRTQVARPQFEQVGAEQRQKLNADLIPSRPGVGLQTYLWEDADIVTNMPYYYWLEAIDSTSQSTYIGPAGGAVIISGEATPVAVTGAEMQTTPLPAFSLWVAVGALITLIVSVLFIRKRTRPARL